MAWLESDSDEDVPAYSWIDFCNQVGIEKAGFAQDLLSEVAAHMSESGKKGLPEEIITSAVARGRNPYVLFMWILVQEFIPEPAGWSKKDARSGPDDYYMINVMKEKCTGTPKDCPRRAKPQSLVATVLRP